MISHKGMIYVLRELDVKGADVAIGLVEGPFVRYQLLLPIAAKQRIPHNG